jgi:hypothetical protein
MRASRVPSRIHLVFSLAMSIAAAAVIASVGESEAQADLNLQTQTEIISAPFSVRQPAAPAVTTGTEARRVLCRGTGPNCVPIAFEKAVQVLTAVKSQRLLRAQKLNTTARALSAKEVKGQAEAAARDCFREETPECKADFKAASLSFTPITVNPTVDRQPTKIKFTFPLNPTYETNVFKSNTNIHADTSFGFGGGWQVVTGVGEKGERPFDLVVLSASSASSRYNAFPVQSADVATVQAFYQHFLGAYGADGTLIFSEAGKNVSSGSVPAVGMMTIDTVAVGAQNQTAFTPFYSKEKANFFTPQVTFARQNINLGNPNGGCGSDGGSFCYFANLALTPAQTLSDVATQTNANVALAASIGTRVDRTNLTVALASTVTGKAYEYFPGGRQDLLVQIGPNLQYGINNCFNASLSATYYRNYSTVRAAAWNGVVVQPTLNIIFPVPAMPDKSKTDICS